MITGIIVTLIVVVGFIFLIALSHLKLTETPARQQAASKGQRWYAKIGRDGHGGAIYTIDDDNPRSRFWPCLKDWNADGYFILQIVHTLNSYPALHVGLRKAIEALEKGETPRPAQMKMLREFLAAADAMPDNPRDPVKGAAVA